MLTISINTDSEIFDEDETTELAIILEQIANDLRCNYMNERIQSVNTKIENKYGTEIGSMCLTPRNITYQNHKCH